MFFKLEKQTFRGSEFLFVPYPKHFLSMRPHRTFTHTDRDRPRLRRHRAVGGFRSFTSFEEEGDGHGSGRRIYSTEESNLPPSMSPTTMARTLSPVQTPTSPLVTAPSSPWLSVERDPTKHLTQPPFQHVHNTAGLVPHSTLASQVPVSTIPTSKLVKKVTYGDLGIHALSDNNKENFNGLTPYHRKVEFYQTSFYSHFR